MCQSEKWESNVGWQQIERESQSASSWEMLCKQDVSIAKNIPQIACERWGELNREGLRMTIAWRGVERGGGYFEYEWKVERSFRSERRVEFAMNDLICQSLELKEDKFREARVVDRLG